jgi:hypothetical protein
MGNLLMKDCDSPIALTGELANLGFCTVTDTAASAIAGGRASASVGAIATAYGPSTYTFTQAETFAAGLPHFSIAVGEGEALAIGKNSFANVQVAGTGDKVLQFTGTYKVADVAVSVGAVLAIDQH